MRPILFATLILIATVSPAMAQESQTARAPQSASDAERVALRMRLTAVIDRDYSNQSADELLMLSIQHSEVAVPELKQRLSTYSRQSRRSLDRNPAIQADALAYVANEAAVEALSDLCAANADMFCPHLGRAFDYAEGRVNPFNLVYGAIGRPEAIVQETAIHWADSMIAFPHFQQRLAEAMLDKYSRVPSETEWATDPIASRLKDRASPELRQSVMRLAAEAQSKRERQ